MHFDKQLYVKGVGMIKAGRQAIFNMFYTRQNIQSKSVSVNILIYNVGTLSNCSAIYHGESKLIKGPLCTIPTFLCEYA
jgi:hypothetical protein